MKKFIESNEKQVNIPQDRKEMCKIVEKKVKEKNTKIDNQGDYIKSRDMVLRVMCKNVEPNPSKKNKTCEVGKSASNEIQDYKQSSSMPNPIKNQLSVPTVTNNTYIVNHVRDKSLKPIIPGSKFYFDERISTLFYNNFAVVNCYIELLELESQSKHNYYRYAVYVNGKRYIGKIEVEKFFDLKWLKRIPRIVPLCEQSNKLLIDFCKLLVLNLSPDKESMIIKYPGWFQTENGLFYLTKNGAIGGASNIRSEYGQNFSTLIPTNSGFRKYLDCIKVTRNSPNAAIMILYTAMSLSYFLFKEAGFTPKFVLFLNGKRGTGKTSVALALTQIEYRETPEYNLKATGAGLECALKNYCNAVLLIDDLAPTHVQSHQNQLLSNLELIVRIFGDATGKKRNLEFNDKKDLEQYFSFGGCMLTGEYIAGCESSLARCLILENDENSIDFNELSKVQQDKHYVEDFAVDFIYHLTFLINNNCYHTIINDIVKNNADYYRSLKHKMYSNNRYSEYYAQLRTTLDLIMYVAKIGNLLTKEEIEIYTKYFVIAIENVVSKNSENLIEQTPSSILCKAIAYGIGCGKYTIVHHGDEAKTTTNLILEDEHNLYISQSDCCQMYEEYQKAFHIKTAKISPKKAADILEDLNVISRYQEGNRPRRNKKEPKYNGKRFMMLDKSELLKKSE